MRTLLTTIFVMSAIWSAHAEVYRIVEGDIVQEYSVDQRAKDRNAIVAEIEQKKSEVDRHQGFIDLLNADIVGLEAVLAELPEPVVEPVIPSEEVVVDENVYPDVNSGSGINW